MKYNAVRVLALAIIGIPVFTASAAAGPQAVTCGAVIDTPGIYVLTGDVSCPFGFPPPAFCDTAAITITAPNVQLNGRGFTVSGNRTGVGVRIMSAHVDVTDIAVERFNIGIEITGGGLHRLTHVSVRTSSDFHCGDGVGLEMTNTNDNRLTGSTVSENERWGVRLVSSHGHALKGNDIRENHFRPGFTSGNIELVSADHNVIAGNDLSGGGVFGVRVEASAGNIIRGNLVNDAGAVSGFGSAISLSSAAVDNVVRDNWVDRDPLVSGSYDGIHLGPGAMRNTVRGNSVFHHTVDGIVLLTGATENVVQGNTAHGNTPVDAADENANCDANTWKGNAFGAVNQPCIH